MQPILESAVQVLTGLGLLASIAIGIGQLTSSSRLRRREAFYKTAAEGQSANRTAILESLRREATAQLIARDAVRWRELVVPIAVCGAFLVLVGLISYDFASVLELPWYFWYFLVGSLVGLFAWSVVLSGAFPMLFEERAHVIRNYLDDQPTIQRNQVISSGWTRRRHHPGGWSRRRHYWAKIVSSASALLAAAGASFLVGVVMTPGTLTSSGLPLELVNAAFVACVAGPCIAGSLSLLTRNERGAVRRGEQWRHPRPDAGKPKPVGGPIRPRPRPYPHLLPPPPAS